MPKISDSLFRPRRIKLGTEAPSLGAYYFYWGCQKKRKQKNSMKPNTELVNNLFGGLQGEAAQKLGRMAQDTRVNMCATYMTGWKEIVPIAEALVAWDTRTDKIVKFISAFIPAMPGREKGQWFKIHKDLQPATPIPMETDTTLCPAWLEVAKMPSNLDGLVFRLFRAYRHDVNVPHRFQILTFKLPNAPVTMVDRRTITVEHEFNSSPVFDLNRVWWHEQILKAFSRFSGVTLNTQTDVKAEIQRLAAAGELSGGVADELLHANDEAFAQAAPPQRNTVPPVHGQDGAGETFRPSDLDAVGQEALAHMQVAGSHIESVEKTISSAMEEAISQIGYEAEDEIPHNPLAEGYVKPEDEPVEDELEVELPSN